MPIRAPWCWVTLSFLMSSVLTFAQAFAPGDQVVVTAWDTEFRLPEGVVGKAELGDVYRVGKVNGGWLWVTSAGGWIDAGNVVALDDAEAFFTQRLEAETTPARYFERALARYRLGMAEASLPDFDKAIEAQPDPRYLTGRGAARLAAGDAPGAIEDHTEALRQNPKFGPAYYNRGIARQALRKWDLAISDYRLALRLNPKNGRALVNRGLCYQQKWEFAKAVEDFSAASQLNPRWPLPLSNRADAYLALRNYKKAMRDAEAALSLDPEFTYAHVNRANVYRAEGDVDRALRGYEHALQLAPNFAPAIYNRGVARAAQEDYVRALKDFQKATELDAEYAAAFNDWAWILATCPIPELRDPQQAVALAERACRIDGQSWNHFGTLAAAYARSDDWEKAVKAQQRAQALLPKSASEAERNQAASRLEMFQQQEAFVDRPG